MLRPAIRKLLAAIATLSLLAIAAANGHGINSAGYAIRGFEFVGPTALPAGMTTLTFTNESDRDDDLLALVTIGGGRTLDDFFMAMGGLFSGELLVVPDWITFVGGSPIGVDDTRVLRQRFVPELAALRDGPALRLDDVALHDRRAIDVRGRALELRVTLARGDSAMAGVRLQHSETEFTDVLVAWNSGRLVVDTRHAKGAHGADYAVDTATLVDSGETLEKTALHLVFDRSVLELIADGRHALSTRVYPEGPPVDRLDLVAIGGVARLVSLEAWMLSDGR